MKALRSSPFLPVASVLQVFILFCCVVGALAGAEAAAAGASAACTEAMVRVRPIAVIKESSFFM